MAGSQEPQCSMIKLKFCQTKLKKTVPCDGYYYSLKIQIVSSDNFTAYPHYN